MCVAPLYTVICEDLAVDAACRSLGHTITGFPNALGQTNHVDAEGTLVAFMEPVGRECYDHTLTFACALLFPDCTTEGRLISPCRSFCVGKLEHRVDRD